MSSLPAIYGAAALLVNSTVWIFGGYSTHPTNGLYALDVSKAWPTSSPSFTNLSSYGASSALLYPRYFSSLALGADQSSLWISGGNTNAAGPTNQDHFAIFSTQAKGWSDPLFADSSLNGTTTPSVYAQSAVTDSKGVVYYYGGLSNTSDPTQSITDSPALLTLDTRAANLSLAGTSGSPGTLAWHTATLVNNTLMYVIGGLENPPAKGSAYLRSALYNTATTQWSDPTADSDAYPPGRYGHAAALSDDRSQIVVFGGMGFNNVTLNDVWTLNLTTNQWTKRNTNGTAPSARAFHNSVMVKNLMIVMFGQTQNASNAVYVLDTTTWTWVTSFNPGPPPSPTVSSAISHITSTSTNSMPTDSTPPADTFSSIPVTAAGIVGITISAVVILGVVVFSVVSKPNSRVKPL